MSQRASRISGDPGNQASDMELEVPRERVGGLPRRPVTELQRALIVQAMVRVVHDRGYGGASVASVTAEAKVCRRTFFRAFDSLEDCFLAILDEGASHTKRLLSNAFDTEKSWLEGVRTALVALLSFFDSDPALAHVLLVEATAGGAQARERRERHIASITSLIEDRRGTPPGGQTHALVNHGVMAALLGTLHTHLITRSPTPVITLLGPLMGLITTPYVPKHAVTREIAHSEAIAHELLAHGNHASPQRSPASSELPELLRNSRAHRVRSCIAYLAAHPGASNQQTASNIHASDTAPRRHAMDRRTQGSEGCAAQPRPCSVPDTEMQMSPARPNRSGGHNDLPCSAARSCRSASFCCSRSSRP
jgi:AcrR family transcriptional regulator